MLETKFKSVQNAMKIATLRVLCPLGMALWLAACAGGQNSGEVSKPANFETVATPVASVPGTQAPVQAPVIDNTGHKSDDTGVADGPRQRSYKNIPDQPPVPPAASTLPAVKRPVTLPEPPPNKVLTPAPDLRQLVGIDRRELGAMLGKPTLRRNEPPAEVWQYVAGRCVLHLFLYADDANSPYRVSHVDAVPRQKDVMALARFRAIATHLTVLPIPVGRRGSTGDVGHLPRTVTPPQGLVRRPPVAPTSHSDALRRLPDEPHRATRRAYPNGSWMPSNGSELPGSALGPAGRNILNVVPSFSLEATVTWPFDCLTKP